MTHDENNKDQVILSQRETIQLLKARVEEPLIVIIAGPRTMNDPRPLVDAVRASGWKDKIIGVISGGCPTGADHYAELWCALWAVPMKVFPADWKAHGKAAGPIRNRQMAAEGDALIALWDGKSRGTANMIQEAKKRGLPVHIHQI